MVDIAKRTPAYSRPKRLDAQNQRRLEPTLCRLPQAAQPKPKVGR